MTAHVNCKEFIAELRSIVRFAKVADALGGVIIDTRDGFLTLVAANRAFLLATPFDTPSQHEAPSEFFAAISPADAADIITMLNDAQTASGPHATVAITANDDATITFAEPYANVTYTCPQQRIAGFDWRTLMPSRRDIDAWAETESIPLRIVSPDILSMFCAAAKNDPRRDRAITFYASKTQKSAIGIRVGHRYGLLMPINPASIDDPEWSPPFTSKPPRPRAA